MPYKPIVDIIFYSPLTQDPDRCNHAVYTHDGASISDQRGHVNFVVRALYCMVLFFIAQLPLSYAIRVDLDRFFSAFSMVVGQSRVQVEPWTYGPGHRRKDVEHSNSDQEVIDDAEYVEQEGIRKDINKRWVAYELYTAGHIPWAVCTNKYPALGGVSDGARNVTMGAVIHFLQHNCGS